MAITLTDDHPGEHAGAGGHHESADERHVKEHLALWLLIGGDAVFLMLELFSWFYLRALDTHGMWRGVACTTANPCADGLGNPIVHEIAKANPAYSVVVATLTVVAAVAYRAAERSAMAFARRTVVSATGTLGLLALLGAIAVQCDQFTALPFTTIDGSYASCFEFFMGSTLGHLLVMTFIAIGLWNRARIGKFGEGRFHQLRLIRIFATWIAVSTCLLVFVMSLFA